MQISTEIQKSFFKSKFYNFIGHLLPPRGRKET